MSAIAILRPYQVDAVQSLRAGFASGNLRQILDSPCGSGKTEMGMALIRGAVAKGKRVMFLCNRIHLIEQTSRRLDAAGIEHGVIQSDNTRATYMPVLVASIQTIAKRGMPETDLIVIDETHAVAGSKELRQVLFDNKTKPIIGLTATAWSKGLGKFYQELGGNLFESVVRAATIPDLIANGYLVDADVYAPSAPDLSKVRTVAGDFHEGDLSKATDQPELIGDIVTHWLKLAYGLPTVCFAVDIAHSKHIVEQFVQAGVNAEHIDCYTNDKDRRAVLARVVSGETAVVSNVGILCEGWDFPACKALILARPTKSRIRFMQMCGRILRPHEGKKSALILDHAGACLSLGFPTDHFEMDLDDGKPKKAADAKPKPEALPKKCDNCKYLKPAKVHKCPMCGFAPECQSDVVVGDGDLALMRRSKNQSAKAVLAEFGSKQSVYSQLLTVQREKGYSDGWKSHKYRIIFGKWPRGMIDETEPVGIAVSTFLRAENIRYAYAKKAREARA